MKENTFCSSVCASYPCVLVSGEGPLSCIQKVGWWFWGEFAMHEVYIRREILMPVKGRGTI